MSGTSRDVVTSLEVRAAVLEHAKECEKNGGVAQIQTDMKEMRDGMKTLTSRTDRWSGAIALALVLSGAAAYFYPEVVRSIVREEIQKALKPAVPVPSQAHALAP